MSFGPGACIHLPHEQTNKYSYKGNDWYHVDQHYRDKGFKCVQGIVNLYDVNKGDATLTCWPGSHKYHSEFGDHFDLSSKKDTSYSLLHTNKDPAKTDWLLGKGLKPVSVLAKAGDLILFDSRTLHQGSQSMKGREEENFRAAVYVSYLPRSKSVTE